MTSSNANASAIICSGFRARISQDSCDANVAIASRAIRLLSSGFSPGIINRMDLERLQICGRCTLARWSHTGIDPDSIPVCLGIIHKEILDILSRDERDTDYDHATRLAAKAKSYAKYLDSHREERKAYLKRWRAQKKQEKLSGMFRSQSHDQDPDPGHLQIM
jgi:hypothetical protein